MQAKTKKSCPKTKAAKVVSIYKSIINKFEISGKFLISISVTGEKVINFGDDHGKINWYSPFSSVESIDIPFLKNGRGRARELI